MTYELLEKAKKLDNERWEYNSQAFAFDSGVLVALLKTSYMFKIGGNTSDDIEKRNIEMFSLIENELKQCEQKIVKIYREIEDKKKQEFDAL